MVVYVDPRLIGRKNFEELVNKYPKINFITEIKDKSTVEVMFTMPQLVKEMNVLDYKKLRFIQYLMAGYDGIDLDLLKENNIIFSNAQDIFSKSIAEDVFTKILYFNRNIKHYIDCKKTGRWEPIREEPELTNSTVLILGTGSIGKELAVRLKAFETTVIGYRKTYKEEENFDEIITDEESLNIALQRADYVILALPLNEKTKYFFNKEKINMMKPSSLLINVARGKVVNQEDLYDALKNEKIRGAGLDVFDPEPLPKDNPIWKLDNVYITPHNASSSNYMRDRLYQLIITNLDLYLEGKPVKYRLN
ncbi:D-2-hydroxyacid dehydrogenase [Candidatus Izemoplasma sp. B36]|uniref:D-2-hydroxyacid dehydrogenase n=1 Tax=Candidatus Izemoplasma sp. B36 TaxID=3242468 RepID=UPI0035581093